MIDNGRVLVEKRLSDDEADPGLILFPGGHVNKGESLKDALKREMKEELGIRINRAKPVLTRLYTASNGERQRIHYFHVEEWEGKIEPREAELVYWESRTSNLDDAVERRIVRKLSNQRFAWASALNSAGRSRGRTSLQRRTAPPTIAKSTDPR